MSLLDCNSETQTAQNVSLGSQRAHTVSDIFAGQLVPVQGLATSRCQQR